MTAVIAPMDATSPAGTEGMPPIAADAALKAWTCGLEVWANYLGRLAAASGPADVLEAGARLSLDSLDICSHVAATRLGALRTPLLNDA